jgi:hypothetical protein
MASSSKPTGVHYALVFFVLLSIVCGVGWLLAHKGAGSIGELKTQLNNKTEEARKADTAAKTAVEQIEQIKKLLGALYADVGTDTGNPNTVLGDMFKHIQDFSNGSPQQTYNATLVKMHEALRDMTMARDKLQDQLATELATFQQAKDELNAMLAQEKAARESANTDKTTADSTHSEELKKKELDLAELRNHVARTQQEYDEYKASTDVKVKQLETRVNNLLAINRRVGDELEQKTRTSFEDADGNVDWVDSVTRRVYINLGEIDGLRPRSTFSVYRKNHSGVGRGSRPGLTGPEDIKGAIEITRVTGPHQAEAKILDEDLYNPIGKGDPIYSPLWSSGRNEFISSVGDVDLDGDGKSDRELFREIIATHGATLDNEVDEKGNLFRNGKLVDDGTPKITEKTKFLVKGTVPEGGAGPLESDENKINNRIKELNTQMDQQARERGIRVISLNDFLSFVGYKAQRRLFVPGEEGKYNLKNAGRGAAAPQPGRGSTSTGNVSGSVSGKRSSNTYGIGNKSFRNAPATSSGTSGSSSGSSK